MASAMTIGLEAPDDVANVPGKGRLLGLDQHHHGLARDMGVHHVVDAIVRSRSSLPTRDMSVGIGHRRDSGDEGVDQGGIGFEEFRHICCTGKKAFISNIRENVHIHCAANM
jgi:hypothetical protein